jgi:serine/threonine-protein kinase
MIEVKHVSPFGMVAAVLVGCSSFDAGDAPRGPSTVVNDAGSDAHENAPPPPPVGQAPAAPGAPAGVTPVAVQVVATVITLAGSGTPAFADGTGATASFNYPGGVTVDGAGNVYVADRGNNRIRKVTATGAVTTLAGSGTAAFADGTGTAASFSGPNGLAIDTAGNLYVCDTNNFRIRKVAPTGAVTTLAGSGTAAFADGTGTAASFGGPAAVAVNGAGDAYIADLSDHRIRRVTPMGVVTTLAGSGTGTFGDGTGSAASFFRPFGVALDGAGKVYVADFSNNRIRQVTQTGVVTTLAGSGMNAFADGTGAAASLNGPRGVAVDARGNVYVADAFNNRIRRIAPGGVVTTLRRSRAQARELSPTA